MATVVIHPYAVTLSHGANPDIRGGYRGCPIDSGRRKRVGCESLAEASSLCRAYIEKNELGAGNWRGGDVFERGPKSKWVQIARISYNGRIWGLDGHEITPA